MGCIAPRLPTCVRAVDCALGWTGARRKSHLKGLKKRRAGPGPARRLTRLPLAGRYRLGSAAPPPPACLVVNSLYGSAYPGGGGAETPRCTSPPTFGSRVTLEGPPGSAG